MSYVQVKFDQKVIEQAQKELQKLPLAFREGALKKGIRNAGKIVAKETARLITPPGYPGDKQDKPPLSKNIASVVRLNKNGVLGIVGGKWSEAAHFHLYEQGHAMWLWGEEIAGARVEGKDAMARAADSTRGQQENAILGTLREELKKMGR